MRRRRWSLILCCLWSACLFYLSKMGSEMIGDSVRQDSRQAAGAVLVARCGLQEQCLFVVLVMRYLLYIWSEITYRHRYTACEPVLWRLAPRALRSIVVSNRPFWAREDSLASVHPCSAKLCSIMFAVSCVMRAVKRERESSKRDINVDECRESDVCS